MVYPVFTSNPERPTRKGIVHPSGLFAVEDGTHAVTHLPTGRLISKTYFTTAQARGYVESLIALDADWALLTNENASKFRVGEDLLSHEILRLHEEAAQ